MGNIGLSKRYHLLLPLLLLVMTGCGANNLAGTANNSAPGNVTAKLVWGADKTTAKTVAAVPAGVTTMRLTVTGSDASGKAIPVVKSDLTVSGGTASGTIGGIYPGTVTLAVQALDSSSNVLFEGYALRLQIVSDQTTNATITMTPQVVKGENSACINCHETTLDNTRQSIVANYKESGHYTNSSWTANGKYGSMLPGCAGCHGTQHNDTDPSNSGRCFECHGTNLSLRHVGSGTNARYLSADKNNCSDCHKPHNPINGVGYQQRKDWAASGHADISGTPFITYDIKNKNNYGDVSGQRCHTTPGFVNFLASGYTPPTTLWGNPADTTTKQVLACNACHNNDFKNSVRNAGRYTAPYGTAIIRAYVQYPDAATSNICLPCHVGQSNEASVEAVTNVTNTSFVNPHYFAAGAILYGKVGFKFYTSSAKYVTTYATTHFAHDQIGVNDYKMKDTYPPTGFKGPCVSCHMPSGSHTLVDVAQGYRQPEGLCNKCHQGAYTMSDAKIEEEKEGFHSSLELFKEALASTGIYFNPTYPYFYTSRTPSAYGATSPDVLKNWTIVGPSGGTAKQNLGTVFNFNLLNHEPGAFAHNRIYSKRLIYDSLEYLQNGAVTGALNFSNFSSATVPVSKARKYLSKEGAALGTRP